MIEELLEKYKMVTKSIISELERDANTDSLFSLREEVLKELFSENNEKSKIRAIYYNNSLDKLDELLNNKIKEEQLKVKDELKEIHLRKNVSNQYRSNINTVSLFNKKI